MHMHALCRFRPLGEQLEKQLSQTGALLSMLPEEALTSIASLRKLADHLHA